MKITKYEHSCLVIEDQGKKLVVDPGDFSVSLPVLDNVVAIVITHVHFDHLNNERVESILKHNPEAKLLSVGEVKDKLSQTEICKPGDKKEVDSFKLEFFGGQHALIHEEYPKFENLGMLVNEMFYYGGDSLVKPNKPVKVLAAPVSGPWSKVGEVMDYIVGVAPELVFPIHDSLNSEAGNKSQDGWLAQHSQKHNFKYRRLQTGESIEV